MILLADLLAVIHGLAVITLGSAPIILLASRRRVRWLVNLFLVVGAITAISFLVQERSGNAIERERHQGRRKMI